MHLFAFVYFFALRRAPSPHALISSTHFASRAHSSAGGRLQRREQQLLLVDCADDDQGRHALELQQGLHPAHSRSVGGGGGERKQSLREKKGACALRLVSPVLTVCVHMHVHVHLHMHSQASGAT
jgi:hypothetical protein